MEILRASEDYLEAMLMLKEELGYIRSIDIAEKLGVTKPSVSYATKRLRENGFIAINNEGQIILTDKGLEIAQKMLERHTAITSILVAVGVDEKTAEEDACKIEHILSEESFEALKAHYDKWLKK